MCGRACIKVNCGYGESSHKMRTDNKTRVILECITPYTRVYTNRYILYQMDVVFSPLTEVAGRNSQ